MGSLTVKMLCDVWQRVLCRATADYYEADKCHCGYAPQSKKVHEKKLADLASRILCSTGCAIAHLKIWEQTSKNHCAQGVILILSELHAILLGF